MKRYQLNKLRLTMLLVMVLGGISVTWGRTSTYKIVNNRGVVVMHAQGKTDKPSLPANTQTPFATNYRYYQKLVDAQNDAQYGAEVAAESYGAVQLNPSLNLSYDGDVFVRYDYNAEANVKDQAGNTLRIDGTAAYNFDICHGRYVWYNSSSEVHHSSLPSGADYYEKILVNPYNTSETETTGTVTDADKKSAAYQWRFIGQRNGYEGSNGRVDPYDIKIVSVADASKVLTAIYTRGYNDGPSNQQYIHLNYLADDNDATHIQRFFFRKLSNTVQIAVSAPLYLYLSGNNKNMWFVLNKEAAEPKYITDANSFKEEQCYQALHMRIHSKQEDAKKIDAGSDYRSTLRFYRQETRKYIILDADGNKVAAANASVEEMATRQVPASIASALPGTTYTYWPTKADAIAGTREITTDVNLPDVIYVKYSFNAADAGNQVKLDGTKSYNMKLGGSYVKYQEGAGDDSDVNIGSEEESESSDFAWKLMGGDPYHIQLTVETTGAGYITGESTTSTIALHTGNKTAALQKNATASSHTPSTYYLVKSPAYTNENPVYLLRASYVGEGATSADNDDDANFYTWAYGGDPGDWNESRPRLYSSAYIEDADEAVQMELEELLGSPGVTYRIIDKSDKVVVEATTRKEELDVPAAIKSPLVSRFYYYLDTQVDYNSSSQTYTLKANPTEMTSTAQAEATDSKYIYVTYDVGTDISLNTVDAGGKNVRYKDKGNEKDVVRYGTFYMLKFLNGDYYYQEDGSNGITTVTKKAEIPYSNGDACMNIYDEAFTDGKLQGGASERTRIPWAFVGGDPYRLKISAYQNSHKLSNGTSSDPIDGYDWYFTYFRTYYNETLGQVITTNVTDDPLVTTHPQFGNPQAVPTEYMVLGTKGKYKLVTSEKINDGNTVDHRTVNSFEQYWKNNETIGKLFGTYEVVKDAQGKNQNYIISMPTDGELIARGWHKYPTWAYAKPFDGTQPKEYDYQNHWFQTFEMGEEFELIEVSMEPSIVLLDNHGWEIFRHSMPVYKSGMDAEAIAKEDAKTRFINTYDSPMVKAYHWYKKANKLTGFHKYTPYDPAISGEEEYTSTSLIDFPSGYATNPGDWYVTYDVKDEYKYLFDDNNGSPLSAPCLIGNDSKWAKAGTGTIGSDNTVSVTGEATNLTISGTITTDMLWYMKPNPAIDTEMGYEGSAITYDALQKGFDPYNIMIRNGAQNFKNNATSAAFNGKEWSSNTDTSLSLSGTAANFEATGADNVTVHPTNFTFMALADKHGNMRLVPRFDHLRAVTELTSGTPKLDPWVYDTDASNVAIETKADSVAKQAITLVPVQKYKFEIRDADSNTLVAKSSEAFYASPGASLYTTLGEVSIPLPRDLIRSYCDYPAAYTSYNSGENSYDNPVTCYPLGDGEGISSDGVTIYVPYYLTDEAMFASSVGGVSTHTWYNIAFNTKSYYIAANTSDHTVSGSSTQTSTNGKWAFIGTPYSLQIINNAEVVAGGDTQYLTMNAEGSAVSMTTGPDRTHWTLVYNDNGDPIMRLTEQISSQDAYIKKGGAGALSATYPNDADFKIFLTNLVTVTYRVWHQNGKTWPSVADYQESVDYELNQLQEYPGLPSTVVRPLCEYTYYKTEADMKSNSSPYASFPALYETLEGTEKESNMDIYLSYTVHYPSSAVSPVRFFDTEAEARASRDWSFLMQGVESAAVIYGKKNDDYGYENKHLGSTPRTYGNDLTGLTPAEQTFTQQTNVSVMSGFHFIRRTSRMDVNASTGAMTVPTGIDSIGVYRGIRYIPSQDIEVEAYMMSPLNDFRRIAETYKDGSDTKFRENSWLWAFIGTPYQFEIINREALVGASYDANNMPPSTVGENTSANYYKRLARRWVNGIPVVQLVQDTTAVDGTYKWTLEQLDNYGDDETQYSFHIKAFGDDKILSRVSAASTEMRLINTPPTSDIAYLKSTAFMAYPWNWSDTKYKTVTVNIYKGEVSGEPVLSKTFTPADRAFVAGDVINGTDGHFFLPLKGTADGTTWKEKGVINYTMPYDNHLINIPYEIRRRACLYTVAGSGAGYSTIGGRNAYTIQDVNEAQTINIVFTVPPEPYAPRFVPESELADFHALSDDEEFHGVKKSDYYYFVDLKNDLSQYAYVTTDHKGTSSNTRFAAGVPDQAKFFIVGDPYNVRLCNAYEESLGGSVKNLARNSADGTTSMVDTPAYWEVVDASTFGSHGYDATSSNVDYRLEYLTGGGGKSLALRTKSDGDATRYYFGKDGKTYATSIYTSSGSPQLNMLAAYRDYPDSRHKANTADVTVTVMRPVSIRVSVYDQEEPDKLVTKNEESDFYALTERFMGVPNNLQRNYCKYTWASKDATPSESNNLLGEDGYYVISETDVTGRELSIYAKYEETDDSPFSRLTENGTPVLKRASGGSPWYNMNIGGRWAFFNSGLSGLRYEINGQDTWNGTYAGKPNNSELTFPYSGSSLPNASLPDRFRKGLHWALVGDPYNFQLRCQRDIIEFEGEGDARTPVTDESGNYVYHSAYIQGAPVNDETGTVVPEISTSANATWWTWLRERSTNRYFLSESLTRRTEVDESGSPAKSMAPRRLPSGYPSDPSADPPHNTLNFKIGGSFQGIANNQGVIDCADGYGIGDEMRLLSVDDVDANNECFDAVVTVYNKINEPVATTGWEEYARLNVKSNGRISTDVMRWGCTYHYWADETMTRYPFTSFSQKDENDNYLIQDKGTVYVTYDYDETLYSSDNEYRWMNLFYNWDEDMMSGDTKLYTETKEGWINSPADPDANKDKAMCDQTAQSTNRDQKWAMIGDPYKFILYNYYRKADAGGHNSYYLYYDGTNIVNHNFDGVFSPSREKQQGIYFTWKVDGTSFRFAKKKDGVNETEYYRPDGLPTSFYNFNGAGADYVQAGYLAVCDMTKTSLHNHNNMLGSIVGYTTFDNTAATTSQYMTKTADTEKRFLVMPMIQHALSVTFHLDPTIYTDGTAISGKSGRDFSTCPVFDYTSRNFGVDNTVSLPWMMRRQYCDYTFYYIDKNDTEPTENPMVDALNYSDTSAPPTTHRVTRDAAYTTYWKDGVTNQENLSTTLSISASGDIEIPTEWNDKHVYIRVTYQPKADFITSTFNPESTNSVNASNVKWLNIVNQEKGNPLRYTRSSKVTGNADRDKNTNDYLWAVEGDPYGFKLHNRYAVHGIGSQMNQNWNTVLTTDKVNSTENYNYSEVAPNFTFDAEDNPIVKSALTYGALGTADAFGTMSTTTTNAVYEAMEGNYTDAMLIHPVNACINVRNQNGYKYYGAFLFNGAPTDYPVQLNYLQEWEAMRNVYANWKLQQPSTSGLISYYDRAGFVGGLTTSVATDNSALFGKLKNNTATEGEISSAWTLVTNPDNIVPLTSGGYYRLRALSSFDSDENVQEQLGGHYVSGYLHRREKDYVDASIGFRIPLHFYERVGQSGTISDLSNRYGNEWADGITNTSLLEVLDPEFDPSSVFCVTREPETNYVKFETQGLVLNGEENALTLIDPPTGGDVSAKNGTMYFEMQDIGQTALQIRAKKHATGESESENFFLSYNTNNDMKFMLFNGAGEMLVTEGAHNTRIHSTKWVLEPVGALATNAAGNEYSRPLKLKMNDVGNHRYFASICLPFNVKIPTGSYAFSCFDSSMRDGEQVTASDGSTSYKLHVTQIAGNDNDSPHTDGQTNYNMVIPANVPALVYVNDKYLTSTQVTTDGEGKVQEVEFSIVGDDDASLTLTTEQKTALSPANNLFKSTFLTDELDNTTADVFVFSKSGSKVGFMRNGTVDYNGVANNNFIPHHRMYYLIPKESGGASKFFQLVLDGYNDDWQQPTGIKDVNGDDGDGTHQYGTNEGVYDLQGRKVHHDGNVPLPKGVYIKNGKKVVIGN